MALRVLYVLLHALIIRTLRVCSNKLTPEANSKSIAGNLLHIYKVSDEFAPSTFRTVEQKIINIFWKWTPYILYMVLCRSVLRCLLAYCLPFT
jgi:hypothetical protein